MNMFFVFVTVMLLFILKLQILAKLLPVENLLLKVIAGINIYHKM